MQPQKIYFIPGRGRKLIDGLGANLIDRGVALSGRELAGAFTALSFQEQVDYVRNDLLSITERGVTHIICVSFGAYLFLQAQATLSPAVTRNTKILLLSPIVGAAINKAQMHYYVPPQSERLITLASDNAYPQLTNAQIHVGEQDWQSPIDSVKTLAHLLNIPFFSVPNNGHSLDHQYVNQLLDKWLMD